MELESKMQALSQELYETDDLSSLPPGLLEWLEKEVSD